MEDSTTEEVKEFNEVKVMEPTPIVDGDEIIEPVEQKETAVPSSEEAKPEPEPETPKVEEPEAEVTPQADEVADLDITAVQKYFGNLAKDSKRLPSESVREWALRLDNSRVKAELRKERHDELFIKKPVVDSKKEDLSEYDPEELKRFETLASKMGFAKRDEIQSQTIQDKNNAEFETFIEAHPEYSPENDKDGVLWNQFKTEYQLYQPPQDPKTLRKVLNKVHNEVYGVQPVANLNKINAQQQKLKVASHTGNQGSKASISSPKTPNSNLRLDMLKGFSEEELKELES